jgi:Protein of unknown function (DUF2934)
LDSKPAEPDSKHTDPPSKPERVELLRGDSMEQLRLRMESAVRDRAYRIYQNSGETPGRDLGHWAEAEGKLISSNLEVRGSGGPWFHCNCPVPAIPAQQIQVALDPSQLIIHLGGDSASKAIPADFPYPIFYWAKWPERVDPSTAVAYVRDSNLTIEVKKADPPAANPTVTPIGSSAP